MIRRPVPLFVALLLILPLTVGVAGAWSPEDVRAILAERIDEHEKSVGIAVGLIDDQGTTVVGYGKLGKTDEREPDGETVFEIGSISKVFTSILLADMVQQGRVGLNDPVQEFLPDSVRVPMRDDTEMTLYHLATHTSGLPRMPDNFAPADPTNPYADYSVEQMYEFLSGAELSGKPGAGAGALRSTVDDMLRFLAANLGLTESPISDAMQDSHRRRQEFSGPQMHIGLGWIVRQGHGRTIHWHNGGTGGYHSFAGFDKERKKGVVVLSNSSNDIDDIGFHLLEPEFELTQFKNATQAVDFDPERFDDYVGRYQLTPDFILSVTRDGSRFFVQATGQGMLEVFPESETRFFATAVEAAVSFVRGEDGKVSHLTLHQGGRNIPANRLED